MDKAEPIKKGDERWNELNETWLKEHKPNFIILSGATYRVNRIHGDPEFVETFPQNYYDSTTRV